MSDASLGIRARFRPRFAAHSRPLFATLGGTATALAALSGAPSARAAEPPSAPTAAQSAPAPATPAPAPSAPAPGAPTATPASTPPAADTPASPEKPTKSTSSVKKDRKAADAASDDDETSDDDDESADSDESPAVPSTAPSPDELARRRRAGPVIPVGRAWSEVDDGLYGSHQEHWSVALGVRDTVVAHEGFDLFSDDNHLPQFAFEAGRTLLASGRFTLAAIFEWDWGTKQAKARGADTQLFVNRLTAGAEGRVHFWRRFYVFGRVAPGAQHTWATFQDRIAETDRETKAWGFTADFSAGAAFEWLGSARGRSKHPRAWFGADGGYGWAQSSKLTFTPEGDTTPVRLQPLSFGELAVRGGFFRIVATGTY